MGAQPDTKPRWIRSLVNICSDLTQNHRVWIVSARDAASLVTVACSELWRIDRATQLTQFHLSSYDTKPVLTLLP